MSTRNETGGRELIDDEPIIPPEWQARPDSGRLRVLAWAPPERHRWVRTALAETAGVVEFARSLQEMAAGDADIVIVSHDLLAAGAGNAAAAFPGEGQAGQDPGDHVLEAEVTLEELAKILGEELELPNIEPKGRKSIEAVKVRYSGVHTAGPESLRHFRRTYKEALKRSIASGIYNPKNPVIVPIREDKRYRSWKETRLPESNAVIIVMMDVSGSMGVEQKELVRMESFWIDAWL
ncbi:MAG: DUF444 family protein, partial [Armatimonadota bacterium]